MYNHTIQKFYQPVLIHIKKLFENFASQSYIVCLVITVDLKVLLQTEKTIENVKKVDCFLKKTKIRKNPLTLNHRK